MLTWLLWPAKENRPLVRLPAGVSLGVVLRDGKREPPKGWHTNIYSRSDRPDPTMEVRDRVEFEAQRVRYEVHEILGKSLTSVPNAPTLDYLEPRLGECFHTSGEVYLIAKEFFEEDRGSTNQGPDWTFLGFVYGGTAQPRHARDRIAMIEDGIVGNGVIAFRLKWSSSGQRGAPQVERLRTNQCALVRDTKGMVKLVPLDHLRSYRDAGLVHIQSD